MLRPLTRLRLTSSRTTFIRFFNKRANERSACHRAFAESGHMKEVDNGTGEDRGLHERLERLSGAIEKKRSETAENDKRQAEQSAIGGETGKAMAQGFRMLAELVAGVLVGTLIGWQIDQWTGLSPLFLIVFLLLGVTAGFWNMMKLASTSTKR